MGCDLRISSFYKKRPLELIRVVLASASPRRVELLKSVIGRFDVFPASIEEELSPASPAENAKRLAFEKASMVAKTFKDSIVIGADTVVSMKGEIFKKPASEDDAARILTALQGKEHIVTTGLAVLKGEHRAVESESSRVCVKRLSGAEIQRYVDTGEPMDKAGAYGIQGRGGDMVVDSYSGSYSNIVGLPIELLKKILMDNAFAFGGRWG